MPKNNNKTLKIIGIIAAIVIALISVLSYANNRIDSVEDRLTADIVDVVKVERYHYEEVMDRLIEQSQDIGEIKGALGRIEDKLDDSR